MKYLFATSGVIAFALAIVGMFHSEQQANIAFQNSTFFVNAYPQSIPSAGFAVMAGLSFLAAALVDRKGTAA